MVKHRFKTTSDRFFCSKFSTLYVPPRVPPTSTNGWVTSAASHQWFQECQERNTPTSQRGRNSYCRRPSHTTAIGGPRHPNTDDSPPPPGPLARGRPTAVAQLAGVSCGAGEGDGSSAPPAAPEKQTVLYSTTRAGAAQMMGWGGRASTLRVRSVRAGACSSVRRRVRVWRHECAHTQARVACGRVDEPLQIITLMLLFFCKRTPPRPPHPVDRLTHLDAQRQLKTLRSRFLLYLAGPSAGRG